MVGPCRHLSVSEQILPPGACIVWWPGYFCQTMVMLEVDGVGDCAGIVITPLNKLFFNSCLLAV